jgi:uncharacterized protein (DUF1501 family)
LVSGRLRELELLGGGADGVVLVVAPDDARYAVAGVQDQIQDRREQPDQALGAIPVDGLLRR